MSRKNRKLTPSQSQSQRCSQLSQTRIDQHLENLNINFEEQVANFVRYLVNNSGHNGYFRRADIQKHCLIKGQQYEQAIKKATEILKNVYGLSILTCDQSATSAKSYVVSNALPYKNYNIGQESPENKDTSKIILLLILTHIFMSNGSVPEASLYEFLKKFKIDVNVRHKSFGNVKDYINNNLIKQKYLSVETNAITKKVTYSWGIRSEKEISKHEILKFVCKMFKNCQPKSWNSQYQQACEQQFENERLQQSVQMEVDE